MNSRRSPVGTFASWTCTRNMAPSRQTSSSPDLRTTSPSTSSRPSMRKGTATSPKSRTPSRRSAARPHVGLCGNASKSWRSRGSSCPRPDRGDEPIASPRSSSTSGHKCSVSPNTRTSLFRDKETPGDRMSEDREKRHQMEPENVKEIFAIFSEKMPALLNSLTDSIYGKDASAKFGQAVANFYTTLKKSGMPREQAARLAQSYHDAGSLRKVLRAARPT